MRVVSLGVFVVGALDFLGAVREEPLGSPNDPPRKRYSQSTLTQTAIPLNTRALP